MITFKEYYKNMNILVESDNIADIPFMKKIPKTTYEYACPWCNKVMGEKDYSFKFENGSYTHTCNPDKPFKMPIDQASQKFLDTLKESCETTKSGFDDDTKVNEHDKKKVDDVINDTSLPDTAEDGKAYIVHWADGRGIFACKTKQFIKDWLEKTGSWAEIVSIKYDVPEHKGKKLKVKNK